MKTKNKTSEALPKSSSLSMAVKISYGLGDTASNLVFQMTLLFLLYFYTDILGIPPAQAGLIFLIARIFDAANDPVMGFIMDHTKSKHGSARVYLKYGPIPLAIVTMMMFASPPFSAGGKFAFALVVYMFWSMMYTMVNIPYSSMTAQMTDDPQERTSLTAVRMICMLVAVVIVSVATEPLVSSFADKKTGWFAAASIYSAVAVILFFICFKSTGKIGAARSSAMSVTGGQSALTSSYGVKDVYKVLGSNKPALLVSFVFLLASSAEYIRQSSVVFYVTYNMGNASLVPVFLGIVVLSMVAGNLLIPIVTKKFDKRGTFLLGCMLASIVSIIFQFMPPLHTVGVLLCAAVSSIGFSVVSTIGWAMLPDTVEYGELVNGRRSEGIIYAFFSFCQKLATAVGGVMVSFVLDRTGYIPNAAQQTPRALAGITSTLGYIPVIFLAASMAAVMFYRIDRKTFTDIQKQLLQQK